MIKMKKWIAVLLLAAMALTLAGCSGNKTEEKKETAAAPAKTEEPAAEETAATESAPEQTLQERAEAVLKDAADLAPFMAEDLTDMAGILPEDYTDFVFLQGDVLEGREILILRAKDEDAAGRLAGLMENYLERRRDENRNYAPKAYQALSAARVERKGLLLVLISGGDAEAETAQILTGE